MEQVAAIEIERADETQEVQVLELSTEMLGYIGGGVVVALL
jgi:hypothetical protein